jgi:transcriptional regulator with XRE-family HTH domain
MVQPIVSADLRTSLAHNLRARRAQLGLTQEKLAEHSGINQTYISDVERARRNVTLDIIERLAKAVSLAPIQLLISPEPLLGVAEPVKEFGSVHGQKARGEKR